MTEIIDMEGQFTEAAVESHGDPIILDHVMRDATLFYEIAKKVGLIVSAVTVPAVPT